MRLTVVCLLLVSFVLNVVCGWPGATFMADSLERTVRSPKCNIIINSCVSGESKACVCSISVFDFVSSELYLWGNIHTHAVHRYFV